MFKRLLSKCTALAVFFILATALLFSLARLLLPVAGQYRSDIEAWINQSVGQPVVIGSLEAQWRGLGPSLKLSNVQMRDESQQYDVAFFEEVNIGIDVVASLLHGRIEPGKLTISGVNLSLVRRPDGTFTVAGIAGPAEVSSVFIRKWLFGRQSISIEKSRVHWRDMKNNTPPTLFRDVNITFRNQGDRHFLSGDVVLPSGMGRDIQFAADITGNFLDSAQWDGEIFVKGRGLAAKQWLSAADLHRVTVNKGIVDITMWSQWRQAKPLGAQGEISVFDLQLSGQAQRRASQNEKFSSLSGRFDWRRKEDSWSLDVDRFVLSRNGSAWLPTRIHLSESYGDNRQTLKAGASFIKMQDVGPLLILGDFLQGDLRNSLSALQPQGELHDVAIRYEATKNADPLFFFQTRFNNVKTQPWKQVPGVQGMTGSLQADQRGGVLNIETKQASIDIKKLFRESWPIDKLTSKVVWTHVKHGWRIESNDVYIKNADIEGRAAIALDWRQGKAPFIDLVASVTQGNAASVGRYLPAHIMPTRAVAWLDDAIVGGRVVSAGVVFRGAVNEFPFDKQQGRFEARAQVVNGILNYAPQWPRLTGIQAEVVSLGRSLEVIAQKAKTLGAEVLPTRAIIPDMTEHAVLTVKGNATGSTADALRFLSDTPLQKHEGKLFVGATARGTAELDLNLVLPLSADPAKVEGVLNLYGSQLTLQNLAEIENINGTLRFSDKGVTATGMRAQFFGQPARVDIQSDDSASAKTTVIKASGNASAEKLAKQFPPILQSAVKGNADWTARIKIPPPSDSSSRIDLRLESQLRGVSVDLPEPFGKPTARTQKLIVDMTLPFAHGQSIGVRYGDNVAGVFDLKQKENKIVFERGELRFGDQSAQMPAQPGLRIAGQLEYFSKRKWDNILQSVPGKKSTVIDNPLRWVDLHINEVDIMGNIFTAMDIKAEKVVDAWVAEVASPQTAGKMRVPHNTAQPVTLDFDYLFLEETSGPTGKQPLTDPREMSPLQLKIRQFKYNGISLGNLALIASKIPDGLKFSEITTSSPHTRIQASGEWTITAREHTTRMQMAIDSDDVGKALSAFGYADSIKNGKSHSEMVVNWAGPPSTFALRNLDGSMHIKIDDGRLLDVDPGAGRIFGLLSLQALPRRLTLDFSDLFAKGFAFDKIEGKFTIENGNAFVDSLFMDGPPARVDVTGRIGLAKRDYDQFVIVEPHITSSLPLAIGITNPAMGAAVWLAGKIFSKPIGAIGRVKYKVTGPWENPLVELISKEKGSKPSKDQDN